MLTNETLHTLETRRSCRAYLDRQVDAETLDAVLQAGTFAPTGMGPARARSSSPCRTKPRGTNFPA